MYGIMVAIIALLAIIGCIVFFLIRKRCMLKRNVSAAVPITAPLQRFLDCFKHVTNIICYLYHHEQWSGFILSDSKKVLACVRRAQPNQMRPLLMPVLTNECAVADDHLPRTCVEFDTQGSFRRLVGTDRVTRLQAIQFIGTIDTTDLPRIYQAAQRWQHENPRACFFSIQGYSTSAGDADLMKALVQVIDTSRWQSIAWRRTYLKSHDHLPEPIPMNQRLTETLLKELRRFADSKGIDSNHRFIYCLDHSGKWQLVRVIRDKSNFIVQTKQDQDDPDL